MSPEVREATSADVLFCPTNSPKYIQFTTIYKTEKMLELKKNVFIYTFFNSIRVLNH